MDKPLSTVQTKVFLGLASGMDAHDLQPGQALTQVNVMSIRAGELTLRRGYRELTYDVE